MDEVNGLRRVVVGLGGRREIEQPVELAVSFASGLGAMLNCLLFEREDLMAASRLPFTRITGHGGISAPMTHAYVMMHLRRVARAVEENLIARHAEAGIDWKLEWPHGE